jgi:hypothetical protein
MKFKDLMLALHNVKLEAEKNGLNPKQIHELEIIDTGILNSIEKLELSPELAQNKGIFYLLIKNKNKK